jgi:hypothetical protein
VAVDTWIEPWRKGVDFPDHVPYDIIDGGQTAKDSDLSR